MARRRRLQLPRIRGPLGLGACLFLLVPQSGCGPQAQAPRPQPAYPEDLASHMTEHFIAAADLETAVIRGEIDEGKAHAAWLAAHEPHRELPGMSGPYAVAVRAAAAQAADANNLSELAQASARMAAGCGGCHAATQGGLQYLPGAPPDESESVTSRMARHVWAADRMWEALLERSNDLWLVGAEVLQTSVVSATEAAWDPETATALQPIVAEIEQIAVGAPSTDDWNDRAGLVGDLLTTCSRCHERVGIDPLGSAGIGGSDGN